MISMAKGSALKISNPHGDLVNFISTWFSPDIAITRLDSHSVFDLDGRKDSLVRLFSFRNIEGYIGKFSGRTDHTHKLQSYSGSVFAFVIEGLLNFKTACLSCGMVWLFRMCRPSSSKHYTMTRFVLCVVLAQSFASCFGSVADPLSLI